MKRTITSLFICLFCLSGMAQISTDEPPVSFNLPEDVFKDQKVEPMTMPTGYGADTRGGRK